MPDYFLNSFHPLGESPAGARICAELSIPSFVDYSIRREPDFEHDFPSITGLCRMGKLVNRARVGNSIAYVTTKSAGGYYLVALLRVVKTADDHREAAAFYEEKNLLLPRNLVVEGNPALSADRAGRPRHYLPYEDWVRAYEYRARKAPRVLICEHLCGPMLRTPPLLPENIFGRPFPGTRTPPAITSSEFNLLQQFADRVK